MSDASDSTDPTDYARLEHWIQRLAQALRSDKPIEEVMDEVSKIDDDRLSEQDRLTIFLETVKRLHGGEVQAEDIERAAAMLENPPEASEPRVRMKVLNELGHVADQIQQGMDLETIFEEIDELEDRVVARSVKATLLRFLGGKSY